MPNRFICDVLDEMRQLHKTRNYSPLLGLIEEAQILANRMEAALYDQKNIRLLTTELRKLKLEKRELVLQIEEAKLRIEENKINAKESRVAHKKESKDDSSVSGKS